MDKSGATLAAFTATLVTFSMACNLGAAGATIAPEARSETAIARTVEARLSLTASAAEATDTQVPPISTAIPPVPATATMELTEAHAATPSIPMISVSVNTNCRMGPGRAYDYRGALLVGETEEVVALSTLPNYWYITNPDIPGDFCYLWGEYATVEGDTQLLPEFTPLPSPTPTNTPTPSNTPTPTSTPTPP